MKSEEKVVAGLILTGLGGYLLSDKDTRKTVLNLVNQFLEGIKGKIDESIKQKEDGIAICEHGVYECPQCITKRLGQSKTKFIEE